MTDLSIDDLMKKIGTQMREPSHSELKWFQSNPHIGGYAADDDSIVLNPFSGDDVNKESVAKNEAIRVFLRRSKSPPTFLITPEQKKLFSDYSSNDQDIRETIVGRAFSGDPSAGKLTKEQMQYLIMMRMELDNTDD